MEDKIQEQLNLLICKDIFFDDKIKKEIEQIFTKKTLSKFIESFLKEKEFFFENITYYLLNNPKIEQLKYIKWTDEPIYNFRFKNSSTHNKEIRCIFFIYEDNKIILLDVFEHSDKKAYDKALKRAKKKYLELGEEGRSI